MKRFFLTLCLVAALAAGRAATKAVTEPRPCGPVPTANQLRWHEMETYAFLHFSINTYTDQEWGYGDEDVRLFDPKRLDARQWVSVCKQAGMKGIILTAKHHCGFCLWPSNFTQYSVKNAPWKEGRGDVVRELSEACREQGLRFAVYLSPWDRNYPEYGRADYISYFRNQLTELLTGYGEMFEVWFDGANGGSGYYGGARETRNIDADTYYDWPNTFKLIRRLQPNAVIWNEGGDLRWIGTEKGFAGITNWCRYRANNHNADSLRLHGVEDGEIWSPGECDVSIRPGWFYHESEDTQVKSLRQLMDIYYQSVGRNAALLLNFPINRDGLIPAIDSMRAVEFAQTIAKTFATDLVQGARLSATNVRGNSKRYAPQQVQNRQKDTYWATDDGVRKASLTIDFGRPTRCNRFLVQEYIRLGQRVKAFSLSALVDGHWQPLRDEMAPPDRPSLTTIGYKRIVCFPEVTATKLKFTVDDAEACPLIANIGVYLAEAPETTSDTRHRTSDNGYTVTRDGDRALIVDLNRNTQLRGFTYVPDERKKEGRVMEYELSVSVDGLSWQPVARGEFANIVNNPIDQHIRFAPVVARYVQLKALRLSAGRRIEYTRVAIQP